MSLRNLEFLVPALGLGLLLSLCLIQLDGNAQQRETPTWHSCLNQAQKLKLAGDNEGAQKAYQVAMMEGEQLQGQARLTFLGYLQSYYELQGDYKARQALLEKLLGEQSQLLNTPAVNVTYRHLARTNDLLGQNAMMLNMPDKAENYFNQEIQLIETNERPDSIALIPVLERLIDVYANQHKQKLVAGITKRNEKLKANRALCKDDQVYASYLTYLIKTTKKNWHPPVSPHNTQVIVHFRLSQNGQMDRLQVFKSSGNAAIDESGLQAVRDACPFRPAPVACREFITVEVVFDYKLNNPY